MALPLTHGAVGYALYEVLRPTDGHRPWLAGAAVALANAPDLDFVPGVLLGEPAAFHRGITHTLGGVLLVAAVVWWAAGRPGWSAVDRVRAAGFAAAAWASHLLIDYLAMDVVPPHGAQFLWPLSDRYYLAPHPIIPEIVIDPASRGAFLVSIFAPVTWPVWTFELGASFLLVALAVGIGMLRSMRLAPARELAE